MLGVDSARLIWSGMFCRCQVGDGFFADANFNGLPALIDLAQIFGQMGFQFPNFDFHLTNLTKRYGHVKNSVRFKLCLRHFFGLNKADF